MSQALYHITPAQTWTRFIQHQGIKTYDLGDNAKRLQRYLPDLTHGIWLWARMDKRLAHDCYLFQRAKKGVFKICVLEVEIEQEWLATWKILQALPAGDMVYLHHPLVVNDVKIHDEQFDICLRPIPPERIRPIYFVKEMIEEIKHETTRQTIKEERLGVFGYSPLQAPPLIS